MRLAATVAPTRSCVPDQRGTLGDSSHSCCKMNGVFGEVSKKIAAAGFGRCATGIAPELIAHLPPPPPREAARVSIRGRPRGTLCDGVNARAHVQGERRTVPDRHTWLMCRAGGQAGSAAIKKFGLVCPTSSRSLWHRLSHSSRKDPPSKGTSRYTYSAASAGFVSSRIPATGAAGISAVRLAAGSTMVASAATSGAETTIKRPRGERTRNVSTASVPRRERTSKTLLRLRATRRHLLLADPRSKNLPTHRVPMSGAWDR